MKKIFYFSYGSNMSPQRLMERVPSATFLTTATLKEHRLQFHKKGRDGSAKCDAEHTANPNDFVIGVVFELCAQEKKRLDQKEGLGSGYEEKIVTLMLKNGEQIEAATYYATATDAALKPFHWYKEHVLRGARECNLPRDYISIIEQIESLPDPDPYRHAQELAIYI